jgi:glycosyltransferase involved in cell wall biosynthesis
LISNAPQKRISVIVPIFDPESQFQNFLNDLLESVAQQSTLPLEVILCGNEPPTYLVNLFRRFSGRLNLVWLQNQSSNAPENINFGVDAAEGEVVKLLFQDDFLIDSQVLASSEKVLTDSPWRAFACQSAQKDGSLGNEKLFPIFHNRLRDGENPIGAPSVVAFKKSSYVEMDSRLPYLFDVDWYLSMAHLNGFPSYETIPSIGIRGHAGQATHRAKSGFRKELNLLRKKHPRFAARGCPCISTTIRSL